MKKINVKELKNKIIDEIIGEKGLDIDVVNQFQKLPKEKKEKWIMNWMNKQMIKQLHEPIYEHFDTIWNKQEAKDLVGDGQTNYYIEDNCLWYVNDDLTTNFCGKIKEEKNEK